MTKGLACPHCNNILSPVMEGYRCNSCNSKFYSFTKGSNNKKRSNNDTLTIIGDNGTFEEVEIITAFEFKDDHKEFIVYYKGEKDKDGNCLVYVSSIIRTAGTIPLLGEIDNRDWERVMHVLKELS